MYAVLLYCKQGATKQHVQKSRSCARNMPQCACATERRFSKDNVTTKKKKTESARKGLNATSVAQFAAVSLVNSIFRFVCAVIIEGFLAAYSASVSLYNISFWGLQLIVKPSLRWSGPRAFIRRRLDLRIVYRTRLHSECF